MRKPAIVMLLSAITFALMVPVNAAAPKAGSTCTKKNATATYAGKLYTCILSGKKLVWDKGVEIKAPKPAPTPITSALNKDLRITSVSELNKVDICKTTDVTPEYRAEGIEFRKNGFPRPDPALYGKTQAKILVIPMSFKDLAFQTEKSQRGQTYSSDIDLLTEVIPTVEKAFKDLSRGRFELKIEVLPKSEWWNFGSNHPFTDVWGIPNIPPLIELINKNKQDFKFDSYDAYAFVGGNGPSNILGLGSAQAAFADPISNSKVGYFSGMLMVGGFSNPTIWVHELGHALFGLEDLYLFKPSSDNSRTKTSDVPMKWDLMADATKLQLLEWNRFLMGWIKDSEVRCIKNQKSTIHYLARNGSNGEPRLLTINLSDGVTLAAEVRNNGNENGLLLYLINTYVNHGEGPIISQNTLVTKGQTKSIFGWDISVVDSNSDGLLISAVKTDVDKFTAPVLAPKPPSSAPQTSRIIVSKGEIVPNGYLKGIATWNVTGHQSYRLYVTAVDDFQKVYFESGIVNDSRSPLVIEISGLPCNKEMRTVTEFYSEKDGKGERQTVESKQLSWLSCEDTTKKP